MKREQSRDYRDGASDTPLVADQRPHSPELSVEALARLRSGGIDEVFVALPRVVARMQQGDAGPVNQQQ